MLLLIFFLINSHYFSSAQDKIQTNDEIPYLFENYRITGTLYPSILTRNSFLLRYPERLIHLNFNIPNIDTIGAGVVDLGFLRNMIDTTFEISTINSIVVCERYNINNQNYHDYTLYSLNNFSEKRTKLVGSNLYLNSDYYPNNNILLFHPVSWIKGNTINVNLYPNNIEYSTKTPFILEVFINENYRIDITYMADTNDAQFRFIYSSDGEIIGFKPDSTGITLANYKKNSDSLKRTKTHRYELQTPLQHHYIHKAEQYLSWFIVYSLDMKDNIYMVAKFRVDSEYPRLKTFYEGEDIILRIHDTNIFIIKSRKHRALKLLVDPELR